MVDVMVKVITGEITTYRNVFPPYMQHETREAQAAEWNQTV